MKNRFWIVIVLVILVLNLAACGNKAENAVIPMDSIAEQVNEPGIYAYASSLKTHYKGASKEGDMGSYQFTLMTYPNPIIFHAPWWVDEWNEQITADAVIIVGHVGDHYTGTVECFKCNFSETIDAEIGDTFTTQSLHCECSGLNNHVGMKKLLVITTIPIA